MAQLNRPQPRLVKKMRSALAFGAGVLVGLSTVLITGSVLDVQPEPTPEPVPTVTSFVVTPTEPTPTETLAPSPQPSDLPPCPTEDSTGCYWDADTMGNGLGDDVVTQPEPTPTETPTTTPSEPESEPWHEMDEGVLICGPNARPAVDYNPFTGWGYWAYCEPALVED